MANVSVHLFVPNMVGAKSVMVGECLPGVSGKMTEMFKYPGWVTS